MNASNMAYLSVGGTRYVVDLFNPLEALSFGNRTLTQLGPALGTVLGRVDFASLAEVDLSAEGLPGMLRESLALGLAACGQLRADEVTWLMNEALRRCYTPHNESLADEAVFNRWFREHAEDMYPLAVHAVYRLVKDFFPKPPVTGGTGLHQRETDRA